MTQHYLLHWLFGDRSLIAKWLGYYRHDTPNPIIDTTPKPNPAPILPVPDIPKVPTLPVAYTRERVCAINIHFQGLFVDTKQFGRLPWFGACLAWLKPEDRESAYTAMKQAGDTHCILHIPSGPALYDEPGQPYNAQNFPPLDWTSNNSKMDEAFGKLVAEILAHDFVPMIFLNGDGPDNYPIAMKQLPIVLDALKNYPAGDLTQYVLLIPGWDSVFYGWEPSHEKIPAFGALFRSLCPQGYLGIEHNIGHIPLGEGPSDWTPTGLMKDFDVLLGEFGTGIFDDSVWQILGRMLGPDYKRPAEQPKDDDPRPPFYLQPGSMRGKFYYCAFEYAEYEWVRDRISQATVASYRRRFVDMGCKYLG